MILLPIILCTTDIIGITDTQQAQFNHPHVHIRRVREFRFREVLKPTTDRDSRASSAGQDRDDLSSSVDNLVQVSAVNNIIMLLLSIFHC